MRIVCIIQARMASSRLPDKVLTDIAGKPMLAHVVERAAAIKGVDDVVVATTTAPEDAAIMEIAPAIGALAFAGHPTDVLDRYYQAATAFEADGVVRITADCPLVDPAVSGKIVARFALGDLDYATNLIVPTFPDGLDTEVVSYAALKRIWHVATLPSDREHVITYIRTNPDLFTVCNITREPDLSHIRWTVDEPDDLEFIRAVFANLPETEDRFPSVEAILKMLEERPDIAALHPDHRRNEGWAESIAADESTAGQHTPGMNTPGRNTEDPV
ncbi:MAG: glycosyltransferase family protein [Chloroflexi bacterium]|nr:glycosyltransferase family protein [Chloroflexota bacterium]